MGGDRLDCFVQVCPRHVTGRRLARDQSPLVVKRESVCHATRSPPFCDLLPVPGVDGVPRNVTEVKSFSSLVPGGALGELESAREEFRIAVALDVNYRSLLWGPEHAREVLEPIARMSNIVFCSVRDGKAVFGIESDGEQACRELRELFGVPTVVSTDQINGVYFSDAERGDCTFPVVQVPVIDRPGAGDSFVAGTLHGYLGGDVVQGIHYGQRTSAYALTHYGDLTRVSPSELNIPPNTDILR